MADSDDIQLINRFAEYLRVEKGLSPLTIDAYRCDVAQLAKFLSDRPLDTAKLEDLRNYVSHLLSKVSASSTLRKVATLRHFYKFLKMDGTVAIDPMLRVESPKAWKRVRDSLSLEEVQSVLDCPSSREDYQTQTFLGSILRARDQAILELFYASAIRASELANARLEDLNLEGGYLKVMGKGSKERIAPLGQPARRALQHYLEQRRLLTQPKLQQEHDSWCLVFWSGKALRHIEVAPITDQGTEPRKRNRHPAAKIAAKLLKQLMWEDSPWLFVPERYTEKLTRQRIWQIVASRSSAVGRKVYPHMLRHTCATQMLRNGADLRTVQEILGHAEIDTTQIYTHVDDESMRKAIARHPRNNDNRKQLKMELPSGDALVMPGPARAGYIICAQCSNPVDLARSNWLCALHLRLSHEAYRRRRSHSRLSAKTPSKGDSDGSVLPPSRFAV